METKEKDKKYSIILGIMILLFLVVVGIAIAWGLGYVHFGRQSENNSNISSGNMDNINEEPQNQDSVNEEDIVQQVYEIYSNFKWVKHDGYTMVVKVKDDKVILNGQEKEINFIYGTPVLAAGNAGHSFDTVYVINDKGEVYVNNVYEVNYDYGKDNFKKVSFPEKIVDMGYFENGNNELLGPYFMTESGKILNSEGAQLK